MMVFLDRYGNPKSPKGDDIVRARKSIHIAFCWAGHFLLIYPPYAPDSAELIGGGIEEGETLFSAASREIFEESGLLMPKIESNLINRSNPSSADFVQDVNFYAQDVNEYWHYHMTFWLLKIDSNQNDWISRTSWNGPSGEYLCWTRRSALPTTNMQFFHKNALMNFLGNPASW